MCHLYREYFKSRSESCCPGCWPWDFQPAICVPLKPGSIKRGNLSLLLGKLTVWPLMLHSSAGVQQWQDRLVWFAFSILLNKYCFFFKFFCLRLQCDPHKHFYQLWRCGYLLWACALSFWWCGDRPVGITGQNWKKKLCPLCRWQLG